MFDASFERLNLLDLLAGLGINPSEGSPRCPNCERPGLVFARHGAQCTCPNCGVDDDIIGLAKLAWGYASIKQTLERFAEQGYAPPAMLADLEIYANSRAFYDAMAALFTRARDNLVGETYGTPRWLLAKLNIDYTEGYDRSGLGRVCGIITAAEVDPGFAWYDDFVKFAKGAPALVFPLYTRRNVVGAFFAINKNGVDGIFAVDELDDAHYLGLHAIPAAGVNDAILVTSMRAAADVLATTALYAIGGPPIIAAVMLRANAEPVEITGIGVTAVTVWSDDIVEAYRWSEKQRVATIAMETGGLPYKNPASVGPYLANVVSTAQSPFRAIALRLLDCPRTAAALIYRQLDFNAGEANCLLAAAPLSIRAFIAELVLGETASPKGVYDGRAVRAGATGWEFADTSERISNFTLALQETWAGEAGPMIRGVVTTSNKLVAFEALLTEVQGKTLKWLTEFLAKQGLPIPHVYLPRLRRHVFDVAVSFGHPEARMSGDAVHWDGNDLVLPGFSIKADGTYASRTEVDAGWTASASLIRPPTTMDTGVFADEDTLWTFLIHIAVNVTHHVHGHRAPGVVIGGAGREAWTTALREGLGLAVKSTSLVDALCTQEVESVFPPIVTIASEHTYLKWIADERHNAILSSPRLGLRVLRYLRWSYVDTKAGPSAAAVAAIPQVIELIRLIIMNGDKIPKHTVHGVTPYYVIANVIAAALPAAHRVSIGKVSTALGVTYRYGKGADSDSLRLTGSVLDLSRSGDIIVAVNAADDSVEVNWPNYAKAMLRHGITAVSRDKALSIYRAARGARFDAPADCVKISAEEWKAAEQWAAVMV